MGSSAATRLDARRLAAWIGEAQPGAQIVYHQGAFAGDGDAALNEALRAAEARGLLYLKQRRRSRYGLDYVAERSSRPIKAETPAKRPISRVTHKGPVL